MSCLLISVKFLLKALVMFALLLLHNCFVCLYIHLFVFGKVLSLLMYPELLMDHPRFPQDAKERANEILSHKSGYSIGMCTPSNYEELHPHTRPLN